MSQFSQLANLQMLLTGSGPRICVGCKDQVERCVCLSAFDVWRADCHLRLPRQFPVVACAAYQSQAQRLLVSWKERADPHPARMFSVSLTNAIVHLLGSGSVNLERVSVTLVPVPARRRSSVVRGGRLVHDLARDCAQHLRARGVFAHARAAGLQRGAGSDQVGLGVQARHHNARESYRHDQRKRRLAPVILIDDIATTGATLSVCRLLLAQSGVEVIGAAVVCATKVFPWRVYERTLGTLDR